MAKEIAEEYASSLADLTVNSKPLINMLTILAEENVDHAGVIVETVEKHLEKVPPEIKLPVLYLVDSIIKNVGGAYTQKFSQSIVNMFTRTFKQVDEKIRSQMFKLRETWHDVFPATKLYQLDVKVNLIDPAWPIQAQPHQSNIHVNPNFLKKSTTATTSTTPALTGEEEKMRSILAKKEQELLMLQRKKIEMELEQTRRQLEIAEKSVKKVPAVIPPVVPAGMPVAMGTPVVAPALAPEVPPVTLPAKARLGPPVNKPAGAGRIAPVSAALISARRDPRLARMQPPTAPPVSMPVIPPQPPIIAPNVFDIKPLERVTKRKNVITIDVNPDTARPAVTRDPRDPRRRDPRLEAKRDERPRRDKNSTREERIEEKRRRDADKERKKEEEKERKRLDEEGKRLEEERKRLDEERQRQKDDKIERKREELRRLEDGKDRVSEEKVIEKNDRNSVDNYIDKFPIADPKKINKLPPIPKINRDEVKEMKEKDAPSPVKRRKEIKPAKKKRDNNNSSKDSSSGSSPEKRAKSKETRKAKPVEPPVETEEKPSEPEVVPFKELKNYHKERYMRRNKEKSESPETVPPEKMDVDKPPENDSTSILQVVTESKDVDLRVLPAVEKAAPVTVAHKRPSTETLEGKTKKNKLDKFDILFGNEDVDLRQLPQVEETAPPPPVISGASPAREPDDRPEEKDQDHRPDGRPEEKDQDHRPDGRPEEKDSPDSPPPAPAPVMSPKRDWNEVKVREKKEDTKKTPSKLDLVRAKLAEATKGKDRLGRPLLFSKEASVERERRRTISAEDTDLRLEAVEDFDAEDHKKTINIIMTQAKEQFSDGQLDKNQYNALMYQVLQLNEKLKLKEAKQRESLELSKRKLKTHIQNESNKVATPKSSPNTFGDIDERVTPAVFMDKPQENQGFMKDSDMRMNMETVDGPRPVLLPGPPLPPFMPYSNWRGQPRPRMEEFINMPRRYRGPAQPFFRGKFDKRGPRTFGPPAPMPLPTPKIGMCQGECPLQPYERSESPPPLGTPGVIIPPTDFKVLEYIDQDPVKTIQIDGVPREIRFYGETGVIMLDWDDPREIKFLPGCRRVTFDNKDSVVLHFNEPYKQVEIDDQVFNIRFGAPTRELYINGRWFESFFGGNPLGVIIDGKPRLVNLEGPLPQVDIGKAKRTDLVAGKINLIVNATQVCPVYLDAKVQKIFINGQYYTLRFVDSLRTVLINEQPFKIEFGDLPKPITINNEKFFIRFSALPRNVKPGYVQIANMEGALQPTPPYTGLLAPVEKMEVDQEPMSRPPKTPSPEGDTQGLDMLASVIPSNLETPASASAYCLAEPLFSKADKIPGLETSPEKEEKPSLPILGNINVTDLFAKLVATGIVSLARDKQEEPKDEARDAHAPPKEDTSVVHRVDLMKSESLRSKQPGVVGKLYGGMQCSGCGARFPPEHTVRYSQHLDWHFRQNRRERDSARRAHSRHWYYDLADWLQYEEVDELPEREKSWFETVGNTEEGDAAALPPEETPSVAAGAPADCLCALCGDRFHQFYNEDKEEWHLKNSVKFEDKNYHPICFEDYKASLHKEEPKPETTDVEEVVAVDRPEDEAIVIRDADDGDGDSHSDDESVVEVIDDDKPAPEPVEIQIVEAEDEDDGDEDDVVLKAEPVEQVVVEDDADTDDETAAQRADRDKQAAIDFANIKIKQEPIDPDDEPEITAEEEHPVAAAADTARTTVLSSIDGNVQLHSTAPAVALPTGGIRINISKTITTPIPTIVSATQDDMLEDISADDEPLPPGEEPELQYTLKPSLEGVKFSRQPPVQKGNELSGLCSIM